MRVLSCGAEALLVEVAGLDQVADLYARLCDATPPGVVELVPAARTVLVRFDPAITGPTRLADQLRCTAGMARETTGTRAAAGTGETATPGPADLVDAVVTVPVRYDGPDLDDVARRAGLTPAEVVERHTRGVHRVAFCGFAPGFAYITGLDPALQLPRRDTPRTRVPAGAVAIADTFTGVYPRPSPGGWHLLGTTDVVAFDLTRDPPALLSPGTQVRFIAVDPHGDAVAPGPR